MDINKAIAKLQPAIGLRLNVTKATEQTAGLRLCRSTTFTEVRFLQPDERATPEHDILLGYGYSHTHDEDGVTVIRPQGQILPSDRLLTVTWSWSPDPNHDPYSLVLTMTHLHWMTQEIKTISHFFVGHPDSIATSVAAAIAAGAWQEG